MNLHTHIRLLAAATLVVAARESLAQAAPSAAAPRSLTADEWRADLRFLAAEMPRVHPGLFRWTPKPAFDSAVAVIDARIPLLNRDQIIVELMQLVALPRDGHTSLLPFMNPAVGFHRLPLQLYRFSDGLFVQSADPRYANIVGGRLVRIGRLTADSAWRLAAPLVPRENAMWEFAWTPDVLTIIEVLHAIGAAADDSGAEFTVQLGTRTVSARIANDGLSAATMSHDDPAAPAFDTRFINADNATPGPLPAWRRSLPRLYGVDWLAASRTLYVQYNAVANAPGETVAQFAVRVGHMLDSLPVDKLVLDLRLNSGGEDFFNRSLTRLLINSKIDHRGHFFVIIGRQTFSAAQLLVNDLERATEAIFVGEPTGNRHTMFGNHQPVIMPNSGIPVMVSVDLYQRDPQDKREWKAPDLYTPLSFAQYVARVDPALDAVIAWTPERTVAGRLRAAIAGNSVDQLVRMIQDAAGDSLNKYARVEGQVNALGYELLGAKQFREAVLVLDANAHAHPASANAFDSLGEANERAGNSTAAISAYRSALELNPELPSSRAGLKRLRDAPPPGPRP